MKHALLRTALVTTLVLAGGVPAMAESLDDYLIPGCGVHAESFEAFQAELSLTVDRLHVQFGEEILARALAAAGEPYSMETAELMWLLGTMRTEPARLATEAIVTSAVRDFRWKAMGGVGFRPDWEGINILLIGAGNEDALVRDTAIAILAENINWEAPVFATEDAAQLREATLATLKVLQLGETEDYLRNLLSHAIARLEAATHLG